MTAVALVLALTAPVLGSGPDLTTPPLEAPVIVELRPVAPPRTPPPTPVTPVQVPTEAAFSVEIAASAVQPKPPSPVVVQQPVARVADHADAIARARSAPNGQLPRDALCPIWDGTLFRCDMAAALESAAAAGMPRVNMTDGYRSYDQQVSVKASRGSWAAQPGTSNHGYGTAADIPEPARSWLFRHGADHGLINPAWAKTEKHEPWHWELAN
ncbi:M15 family metallopeptidase [Oerskovia enterophila]|uniref:M15 family metallopeptidase n=1 Tax=Oerskovia enterophila TaxID=43678 RepID=UPI0037F74CC0